MKRAHVKTARAPVAVVAAAAVIAVVGAAAAGVAGASTADRAKAPNTKLQAPEKLQVSNPKCQPRLVLGIFSWSLGFGVSMELGASHPCQSVLLRGQGSTSASKSSSVSAFRSPSKYSPDGTARPRSAVACASPP